MNAIAISFLIAILLALINIGSSIAFNAIVSLGVNALISSYIISISCIRLKKWRGEPLPPSQWTMGKMGSTINTISILYLIIIFIFTFFPPAKQVTVRTMNWAPVIYGAVMIISLIYYVIWGRHVYTGPVVHVRPVYDE